MYSVQGFGRMIADRIRTDAYHEALRRAIQPGAVVLDIGTGGGVFALLACRFGARKVYAVEPGDVIQLARDIAAANGCLNRIEFIQNVSTKIELPEQVNVIVSDIRGVLPAFAHHLPSIIDARSRHLAPGGVLIPQRDTLWAAVIEDFALYDQQTGPWNAEPYGFDMTAALPLVTNQLCKTQVEPGQLLTEPTQWAVLDYRLIDATDTPGRLTWTVGREGTGHGISLWFDTTLVDGIGYSNSPSAPRLIYGQGFLPWPAPVRLAVGDVVSVTIDAHLVGKEYVWRWDTSIEETKGADGGRRQFRQSTFFGTPLSADTLHRRAPGYVPRLREDGEIDLFILGLIDGQRSLLGVAEAVAARYPSRFPTRQAALSYVADLSQRFA